MLGVVSPAIFFIATKRFDERRLSYKNALEKVRKDGSNIFYLPDEILTQELIEEAVSSMCKNGQTDDLRNFVKNKKYQEFMNYNIYLKYVETCSFCLDNPNQDFEIDEIPEEYITDELLLNFIKNSYLTGRPCSKIKIEQIYDRVLDQKLIDDKFLKGLVDSFNNKHIYYPNTASIYNKIPKKYWSKDLYIYVVKKDGKLIKGVPKDMCIKDLCEIAIKNGASINDIPEKFRENL